GNVFRRGAAGYGEVVAFSDAFDHVHQGGHFLAPAGAPGVDAGGLVVDGTGDFGLGAEAGAAFAVLFGGEHFVGGGGVLVLGAFAEAVVDMAWMPPPASASPRLASPKRELTHGGCTAVACCIYVSSGRSCDLMGNPKFAPC